MIAKRDIIITRTTHGTCLYPVGVGVVVRVLDAVAL